MPTVFSHPAAALALGVPRRVAVAAAVLTILPDADVVGLSHGIPYGSTFGHRGFTHSILFAAIASLAAALPLRATRRECALLFLCALSHGVLDAMTDGGRGIAFFSPFSNARYFLPWRPIRVSPIGGINVRVLASEMKWVWAPAVGIAILRRFRPTRPRDRERAEW